MTDSETIRRIGEALFGRQWQTDLAEALSVSSRTVRRWVSGEDNPRPGVWQDLAALLLEREQRIRQILTGDDLAQRTKRC
jgi:transcriptional regulator with XRE-family HTH domain